MKPADLRNATWREVQTHLNDDLLRVHAAWQEHGPGTTRQVSDRSGISLLTFRPRTTDLCDLGLVRLISRAANEGVYAHVTIDEAGARWATRDSCAPACIPQVNTLPEKDQLLAQIRRLPLGDQLSIAGAIRAAAAHQPRHLPAANQQELILA